MVDLHQKLNQHEKVASEHELGHRAWGEWKFWRSEAQLAWGSQFLSGVILPIKPHSVGGSACILPHYSNVLPMQPWDLSLRFGQGSSLLWTVFTWVLPTFFSVTLFPCTLWVTNYVFNYFNTLNQVTRTSCNSETQVITSEPFIYLCVVTWAHFIIQLSEGNLFLNSWGMIHSTIHVCSHLHTFIALCMLYLLEFNPLHLVLTELQNHPVLN